MAATQLFVEPSAATQAARNKFWQLQMFCNYMHQWSSISTRWIHLLSPHERLKAAVKIRHFFPQIYWVSTLTAATFASYLSTWKSRLLYQLHAKCHKLAAGCSAKIIFAFEANLLALLIPSGLTEMKTRSQTFHGHEQLTVAFHLRFLTSDNESRGIYLNPEGLRKLSVTHRLHE